MQDWYFSSLAMTKDDLGFEEIFTEVCPNEFNEFGLKREMRFVSERIVAEYDPSDQLSVREIMHPMDAFRTKEPYFKHKLADKSKHEFVTSIDFHEHITYFPYSKNTGDICLARYISNFNDINFTKISGQDLCSLPGETIYGVRVGRLDKGLLAANHRTGSSVNSTVTVIDLVKPARTIAYYDSPTPVNTIDWVWYSQFLLAVGDDTSLRIMDARSPKSFNAVFFDGGVQKTALCSTRPLEIACWNGSNVLLYDVRRPDVPCAIYDIGLKKQEIILDMKFNPYVTDELFVHTNQHRVFAMKVNPAHLIGGKSVAEKPFKKWQVITFKHIDRGCYATRHSKKRRELMPYENEEIPLYDYYGHYEASKNDPLVPVPNHWVHPSVVDKNDFKRLSRIRELDYESYLYKAVERVAADTCYKTIRPKVFYEAKGVETYDFVFPGVNGIMCYDRLTSEYKIVKSPKHYEGSINPYTGSDAVHLYRTIQIREMIPAQTLTMICNRLENRWDAYQTTQQSLKDLAITVTEETTNVWSHWLRNTAIMQYGGNEFAKVGLEGLSWKDLVKMPKGPLPVPEIPPYDYSKDATSVEEVCQMVAPFFRLFLPDPRPDLFSDSESETDEKNAPPSNPYEMVEFEKGIPSGLSYNMRTLCKCHAKMRYYNKKQNERKYMYCSTGNTFFVGASKRIREKFFKIGWQETTKPQILAHRLLMDTKIRRKKPIQELSKFQRFKPREFQKRVLPPKLITETASVFMKPEYVREREQKEKEMKERAAEPITAPIGLTLSQAKETKKAPVIPDVAKVEDPERARFLIRAAIQLADNNSSDEEGSAPPPQTTPTPPPPPPPSAAAVPIRGPQATSTRNEKDDFEYETAEDAFFGIKKKRMYVIYQPATVPLGLRRYKPVRLRENTFVRRLEHLMYWGRRRHERDILYGRFKENDKRQSSVKERYTLDLKLALNNHMKVGWQTFYDYNFFFSNKCSYNQILRKAIQVYNRMFNYHLRHIPIQNVRHERMLFGVNPRYLLGSSEMEDILDLRQNYTVIENPAIDTYNQFMNYLQSKMPYQFGYNMFLDDFQGDCPLQLESKIPTETVKQTAVYDLDERFMYPKGKIRFCEFDIPPAHMREIERRRLPPDPIKKVVYYLEDIDPPPKTDYSTLRRTRSCPNLSFPKTDAPFDVMYSDVIRRVMGKRFLDEFKGKTENVEYIPPENYESLTFAARNHLGIYASSLGNPVTEVMESTKFLEWDSPMIADTDRKTGHKFMRRVVPFKEPQPPRQIVDIDPWFPFIPLETLQDAERTINVTYIFNDPPLFTWPGLQVLDRGRYEMFTLCPRVPRIPKRRPLDFYKTPLELPDENTQFFTNYFTETMLKGRHPTNNRVRPPIYDELSLNIPYAVLDLLKPVFYGYFVNRPKNRYNEDEVYEMNTRRELQQAILEKRIITFRQPVIEETEQELAIEEHLNVEEDDLRTTSEESDSDEETIKPAKLSTFQMIMEESSEEELDSGDEAFGFWKMFKEEKRPRSSPIKRKLGMFSSETDPPVYTRFNPHTRTNMRKLSMEKEESNDEPLAVGSVLTNVYEQNRVKEKRDGDVPLGSPKKSSIKVHHSTTQPAKPNKSVSWGRNIEHRVPPRFRYGNRRSVEVDRSFLQELYTSIQLAQRIKSTDNIQRTKTSRKNSDPTIVSYKGLPRRSSLDQFYKKDATATCPSCIQEPWPTKEACISCRPETAIYSCSSITKLRVRCPTCRNNIYKFSCMNYEFHSQLSNRIVFLKSKPKLRPIDEKLRAKLAVEEKKERIEDTPAIWTVQNYKPGTTAVDNVFLRSDPRYFSSSQSEQLSGYYYRDFRWICWNMDDEKAEKVIVSEEFDKAFDRDADIDMMRDTMNTISQDGEMDMMTTYDQRTGMRVRRWISYAALATRVQKQSDKARFRKKIADREARILAGEIPVKPALLEQIKQKAKEKEDAASKATEIDENKKAEEKRRQYKIWKKLPIPVFPEDTRKDMPNFTLPKSEDWLESSGSEDELPLIRSRILSTELKEFISTIRTHMERKPKHFDGLKVTYGKLFEKRPILKNDIVLVTKKKNRRRRPPPFRIQRLPLEDTWLNTSLSVDFVPRPNEPKQKRNSMKWTIPFYSAELLNLSAKETKERTFRPPTPPPGIKEVYSKMKSMEKAFYHKQHVKVLASLKKAKVARHRRFHKNRNRTRPPKAWTIACRRAHASKPKRKRVVPAPRLPITPDYKKYIFEFVPKKDRPRYYSSSEISYCDVVRKKTKRMTVVELSDEEYCPHNESPVKHAQKLRRMRLQPTGLIDREIIQQERKAPPKVFNLVSIMKKKPAPEERKRRKITISDAVTFIPEEHSENEQTEMVQSQEKEVHIGQGSEEDIIDEQSKEEKLVVEDESQTEQIQKEMVQPEEMIERRKGELNLETNPVSDHSNKALSEKISKETRAPITPKEVKKRHRLSRKREPKVTTSSSEVESIRDEIIEKQRRKQMRREKREEREKQKERKIEKYIPERARSAPLPVKRKSRDQMPIARSFSVDSGSKCKKALKILAHTHKKAVKRSKREAEKAKREGLTNAESPEKEDVTVKIEGTLSTSEDSFSFSNYKKFSRKRPLDPYPARDPNKARGIAVSKRVKASLAKSMAKAKLIQSSRAEGLHAQRPLLPRWLPSDHETVRSEMESESHYQFQHMRFKRYSRKRKILHLEPLRSRVLNTIRRLHSRKEKHQKMKYKKPMLPEITDLFLNPWEPLLSWPAQMRQFDLLEAELDEVEQESEKAEVLSLKPEPMSWKQMLLKLSDQKVSIKKIRLTTMRKRKQDKQCEAAEAPEKLLEIVVAPTENLKPCMRREGSRRSLLFASAQPREKDNSFLGMNKSLRLVKPPVSTQAAKKSPVPVDPVTSLLNPSIHQNTWLTNTPKPSKPKEGKAADIKKEDEQKTPSQVLKVDVKPSPPPLSPKPTLLSPGPQKDQNDDEEDDPTAPPPKAPADQQWRAAMMARRYIGASKPVIAPSAKKKKKEKESSETKESKAVIPTPVKDATTSSAPQLRKPVVPVQPSEAKPATVTVPTQLPRMAGTKVKENKVYEEPVAKPKATGPPPVTPKSPIVPKTTARKGVHSWYSDSSDDTPLENEPTTSGTPSVSRNQVPTSEEQKKKKDETPGKKSENPPKPEPAEAAKPVQKPASTPARSFFSALIGRKKVPPLSISTTEEAADTSKSSPILPHIKKPETGQLMKRSPTSDTPRHPPIENDATIVKFVDGKPIADLAPVNFAMSQRRRNRPTGPNSGTKSGSSSGSGSDNEDGPSRKTSQTTVVQGPKLTSALKPSVSEMSFQRIVTQSRYSSGKSVRFGPTSYAPVKPPTPPPEPVVIPKPEPRPEISFETLAEEMLLEQERQREEEEKKRRMERAAIAQQERAAAAAAAAAVQPKEKTPPVQPGEHPSTSTASASSSVPTTSAASSSQPNETGGTVQTADSSAVRKTSTRRQKVIEEDLPKPAKPEPEQPPQLEVPRGVQRYDPVSQRKYYTRHGHEWKPPRKRIPLPIPPLRPLPPMMALPDPEPLPAALPPPLPPAVKQKKRRKKEPEPVETTLVLDGTKHFSKLTAENLKLLNREFDDDSSDSINTSLESIHDYEADCIASSHKDLVGKYRELKRRAQDEDSEDDIIERKVLFHPNFNDSIIPKTMASKKAPKYDTISRKLKRMEKKRMDKIRESGLHSLSERESAINAVRHVKKVKFFLANNKKMLPPVASDFKPKSILKNLKPPITWFYRIDCEGLDQSAEEKIEELIRAKQLTALEANNSKVDQRPEDVLIEFPKFDAHPPSRSLSWTTVSTNASLNSLLDALTAVGSSPARNTMDPEPEPDQIIESPETEPEYPIFENDERSSPKPKISKQYPVVYVGATVGRSPSTSLSAVNLNENEAISSVAQDGSEILEYVGQEESTTEPVKRRFDPFVRPISALFNAFGGSSTEVGTDAAASRSRPAERTFGGLFRRSSPPTPELSTRPVSESPTRKRVRLPITSISQGSSAEDILALMQAEPDALQKMEEAEILKNAPPKSTIVYPMGTPMWREELKLKYSLFNQFKRKKEESMQRKLIEYLDHQSDTKPSNQLSVMKSLVTFNLNEYMKTNKYPRPFLDTDLLGKYDPKSLKIYCSSRSGARRSSAIIVKKITECQKRFEEAKKLVLSKQTEPISKKELAKQAKESMKLLTKRKPRRIRAMYKFKQTCIKYRVKVTIKKSDMKVETTDENKVEATKTKDSFKPIITTVKKQSEIPSTTDDTVVSDIEEDTECVVDYDGDNDDDLVNEDLEWVAASNPAVVRKNQRSKLLKKYFYFSVRMAKKVSRLSVGAQKPFIFYAFISKLRARIHQFMDIRRKEKRAERLKNATSSLKKSENVRKIRNLSDRKRKTGKKSDRKPLILRDSLKYGNTTQNQVIVEESKFNFRKLNAKLETFFECLDEYIDVGTPIKLMFRSKNTYLPVKMFDTTKKQLVDPVYYSSPTPCNTDSDFSDFSADDEKVEDTREFFERESLESTFHVKGLPGLLYLARLVQERVGDDIERNIPFHGPGMESSKLVVYMTPIRRLMLNSLGLKMADRLNAAMFSRTRNDNIEVWFTFLYKMLCYGRGDFCKYIIDKLSLSQGPLNKKYDTMDLQYQAHIAHKLYKKMIYLANGREAKLALHEFFEIGLDIDQNPLKKPFKLGVYDYMLHGDRQPWTRKNWTEACDQFLAYSTTKESVLVTCQASLLIMRMIFTGGHSQNIIDKLISMSLPVRDKLLFIINLTPPDNIVENIVKMFHTVRGLDRLPFVGLGYHADPLRVLFEEAVESGDPQLIAHFVRIGRCLDRRSREPMMTDCGSDHIQSRDFANIMCKVFDNGKERRPYGAPTMDEMFPFRYVMHPDGTEVTETTEELAEIMECEVTRYMAILELTKGASMAKGDLDHNPKFQTYPNRFFFDVVCTGCKTNVCKGRNLGRLGRTLCVSTMPMIEQDKDKKRWPNAKTMSMRLTWENYIETLDPTENKMLMAKDIEEEKTDITVQVLPSRFGCFQCRFSLPRCVVCMCPYLNDHMDFALKERNERFSQFSVCNICNHGGHVSHIAQWFESETFCPVAGCDCKCQRAKYTKNLKGKLRRHMLLSANMRAKSHLCNPECAIEADIDEGYLPDPDATLIYEVEEEE
uniref:Zinc_ribbon_16 domain-containing protein n=1 Tax=Caenorhabditis tropicalis TaxID=1561998 RepID=A0A1I7SZF8_9PELO